MLVLTRKKDEQIRIGEEIVVTVIRIKGKSVRLGIQAPRTEPVLRGELEFREPAGSLVVESSEPFAGQQSLTTDEAAGPYHLRRPLRDFLAASVAKR